MCETRVRGISEDPLDCRRGAGHGNGPECREETDCVFAKQNVYFSFYFMILYILFIIYFQ